MLLHTLLVLIEMFVATRSRFMGREKLFTDPTYWWGEDEIAQVGGYESFLAEFLQLISSCLDDKRIKHWVPDSENMSRAGLACAFLKKLNAEFYIRGLEWQRDEVGVVRSFFRLVMADYAVPSEEAMFVNRRYHYKLMEISKFADSVDLGDEVTVVPPFVDLLFIRQVLAEPSAFRTTTLDHKDVDLTAAQAFLRSFECFFSLWQDELIASLRTHTCRAHSVRVWYAQSDGAKAFRTDCVVTDLGVQTTREEKYDNEQMCLSVASSGKILGIAMSLDVMDYYFARNAPESYFKLNFINLGKIDVTFEEGDCLNVPMLGDRFAHFQCNARSFWFSRMYHDLNWSYPYGESARAIVDALAAHSNPYTEQALSWSLSVTAELELKLFGKSDLLDTGRTAKTESKAEDLW